MLNAVEPSGKLRFVLSKALAQQRESEHGMPYKRLTKISVGEETIS